ncbi:MAG: UDP-N-acetylmuramoyl-L-alanyl-D-glutamate--2,6-diaminopimelate ligase [Geminicoccaceae bacterium]
MRLPALLAEEARREAARGHQPAADARVLSLAPVTITGIAFDSRKVEPGNLFAALSGTVADGHIFIPEAVRRGAVAVLGTTAAEAYAQLVPVIIDPDPRRRLATLAAAFYPGQPAFTAGVTGTNGKTSIASFTRQIWDRLGIRAASLGTLGLEGRGRWPSVSLTTPDAVTLHRVAAELVRGGVGHLVVEASSHGLDQQRLAGLDIHAAAFSNMSRDHFDYHGSYHDYFMAKRRLFTECLVPGGTAVLNADSPEFSTLVKICNKRGCPVVAFGEAGADLKLLGRQPDLTGQVLEIAVHGRTHRLRTRLVGAFQAHNVLAALGLAVAGGAPLEQAVEALAELRGAPGRMQLIVRHPTGAPAFVDYAHTPDALAKALDALRPHTKGRLHVVFGCGGNRDKGKRPLMGEVAVERADRVWVTDDNPRNEDPVVIRRQILEPLAGRAGKVTEIGDRAAAIRAAFAALEPGDVLIVAGKGHEQGQIVGDETLPFDDATELRTALAGLESAA